MLLNVRGWGDGVSECSRPPIFTFFIKENLIFALTRHHAEPNINILLTRNLPFGSGVTQWSYPLMIPMHCLWAKSNNRTHGQFDCDVTWFCFCFDFVRSHMLGAAVVPWFVYVSKLLQIKQVDCKISIRNVYNYK